MIPGQLVKGAFALRSSSGEGADPYLMAELKESGVNLTTTAPGTTPAPGAQPAQPASLVNMGLPTPSA